MIAHHWVCFCKAAFCLQLLIKENIRTHVENMGSTKMLAQKMIWTMPVYVYTMGPKNLLYILEVLMVNHLVFRWPKWFLGAHGISYIYWSTAEDETCWTHHLQLVFLSPPLKKNMHESKNGIIAQKFFGDPKDPFVCPPENRPSQKESSLPTIHFEVLC